MAEDWTAWGDHRPELSKAAQALLARELGPLTPREPAPIEAAQPAPSRLPSTIVRRLRAVVGDDAVRGDDESRARHAGGQSYVDLVRRRNADASDAPDVVVLPGSADEVARVLRVCANAGVAVVPWGGGTSVVGGLAAHRAGLAGVVALDLSRLDALLAVDPVSQLATFQPGIRTPAAEAALAEHGLTLGHIPQSFERASLGGYVVTRSAGQASTGVGRIDDLLAGVRLATPAGELVLPAQPGSAAGPDLRRLVLGSEGTLGVVTELTLRVRRPPAVRRYEGWLLRSWADGHEVLRGLAQDGPLPDIARLSDPEETRISLALSAAGGVHRRALDAYLRVRRVSGGCLLIVGFEGSGDDVGHRRGAVGKRLRGAGAVSLGERAGRAWEHGRLAGPYLRDTLLDAGVLVETLETATTWSDLARLDSAVRDALHGVLDPALVGCHVSHLYPTGASLYFTVLAAARAGDEIAQWEQAKRAANDAVVSAGGTITHHHGVGTAHRDHVAAELGPLGVQLLHAVKHVVDPRGVLNPGKLLPPH